MLSNQLMKTALKTAVLAITVLLIGVGASFAQTVNLAAGPTSTTLPDGQLVPMWGYTCGATVGATCAALKTTGGWSPVLITVPTVSGGASLTINLTNSLPTGIPTSLTIVGALGGGLGDITQRTTTASPDHAVQGATWPMTPTGSRRIEEVYPAMYSPVDLPSRMRAAPAKNRI